MARRSRGWDWDIVGYQDASGEYHREPPPPTAEPDGWKAVIVHTWDPRDEEEERYSIIRHPEGFQSWYEILSVIGHTLASYGIEMA